MSISFLAIPPFTDLEVLKDRARALARSSEMTHSQALDRLARDMSGKRWESMLQSDVATLSDDGDCYCSVLGIPIRITSLQRDAKGNPVAAGKAVHLSAKVHPSCAIGVPVPGYSHPYQGVPGLLVSYLPAEPDDTDPNVRAIKTPTLLDGSVVSPKEFDSQRLALRVRLGPIVESVRLWVVRKTTQTVNNPQELPAPEYALLLTQEHARRQNSETRYADEDTIQMLRNQCEPMVAANLARFLLLDTPLQSDAHQLLSGRLADTLDIRLGYAWAAFNIEKDYLERFYADEELYYWDDWQTRDYMRHGRSLADLLGQAGQTDAAIEVLETLYRANPRDNQGNRYPLCGRLLERGTPEDIQKVRSIIGHGDDEVGRVPMMTYISALADYAEHGDTPDTRLARDTARSLNPHIPGMISSGEVLIVPESYSWGDESEATFCLTFLKRAILKMPGAATWLKAR